jgi:uncharacterized protein YbjT (DUF2867 family)
MMSQLILVTGATGTVGSEVVKQLVEAGRKVRALVRNPAKAKTLGGAVEIVVGDLEKPETLGPAFEGVDAAFVLCNASPLLPVLESNAFEAAKRAGVRHIVKLSGRHINADFMAKTALVAWHAPSEQRLQTLGIPWTILRPGNFASNFLMWLDRDNQVVALPVGTGRESFIDPRDIAAVAIKLLTTPGHDGRIYEISGSESLDFGQVAKKLAAATGRAVRFVDITEEAARDGMLAMGVPVPVTDSMLSYFAGVKGEKNYAPTSTVSDVLGRPARSFDEWANDNRALLAS